MKSIVFSISIAFVLVSCVDNPSPETVNPNVIIILADDLGYGDLSCYNPESKVSTPNLDKLAKEGTLFTDVHSPSSVCTPTRYGLLTGRYAWRTRLKHKVLWPYAQPLIDDDRHTLPKLFKRQGYQTAMFGKWHLGWRWGIQDSVSYDYEKRKDGNWGGKGIDHSKVIKSGPNGAGFDYAFGVDYPNAPPYAWIENGQIIGPELVNKKPKEMFGSGGLMQEGWTFEQVLPGVMNKAKSYLDTVAHPFFMYLSLTAPHTPIMPNASFEGKSGAGDYGDFIVEMDTYIGEVIAVLKEQNKLENTLIIFTSDNGSPAKAADPFKKGKEFNRMAEVERRYQHFPNAPLKGYKAGLYEGGHRVPFIAYWKGQIAGGATSDALFGLQDLMATFHTFFNQPLPPNAAEDSYDISAYLMENRQDTMVRDHIIMHGEQGTFAIRKGPWKLIADHSSGGTSYKYRELLGTYVSELPGQLYNLKEDPTESNDVYTAHPKVVQELQSLLLKYIENGRSTPGEVTRNDPYPKPWKQVDYIRDSLIQF